MSNNINKPFVSFDDFFEDVWDYVSEVIVDDDLWDKHKSRFQELTFDLYQYYNNTTMTFPTGEVQHLVSSKIYARMIESFVKNFKDILNVS